MLCDHAMVWVGKPTRAHIFIAVLKEEAGVVALLGNDARNGCAAPFSRGPDHLYRRSQLFDLQVLHLFELPFADPVAVVNDLMRQQPASLGSSQDGRGHALQLLHPNTHVWLSFLQGIHSEICKEGSGSTTARLLLIMFLFLQQTYWNKDKRVLDKYDASKFLPGLISGSTIQEYCYVLCHVD
jgi:hypothetical protein